jgi:hypothetical protein
MATNELTIIKSETERGGIARLTQRCPCGGVRVIDYGYYDLYESPSQITSQRIIEKGSMNPSLSNVCDCMKRQSERNFARGMSEDAN